MLSTADDCVVVVVVVNATADDGAGSPNERADEVVVAAGAAKEGVVDETAIGFIPKLNDGAELVGGGNVKPVVPVEAAGVVVNEKAEPGAKAPPVDCGSFGAKLVTVLGIVAVGFGANNPVVVVDAAAGVDTPNPPKEGVDDGKADEPLKNPPNADGVVVFATGVD